MTEYDRKILKEIAEPGSQKDLNWGAGISVALGYLQGLGLVTRGQRPQITDKGRQVLRGEA